MAWNRGRLAVAAAAVASGLAAGCAVGPNYVAPEPAMPGSWELELSRGLAEGQAGKTFVKE